MSGDGAALDIAWTSILATSLWRACWQGAAAVTLVAVACRALPAMPPWARCWLWRVAYLKLFVALVWATPVELPLLPAAPVVAKSAAPQGGSGTSAPGSLSIKALTRYQGARRPILPHAAPFDTWLALRGRVSKAAGPHLPAMLPWLVLVWMAGAAGCVLAVVRDWRASRRLRREAFPIADAPLLEGYEELARRLGLRRLPRLLASERVGSPVLVGALRSALVLPPSLVAVCSRDELRPILAHELAHVKRHDLLWAWLPAIGRALFFFHPWLWLARREWWLAHEIACDAIAMRILELPAEAYGQVVLKVAARRRPHPYSEPLAVGAVGSYETLRRRFVAMQQIRTVSRRRSLLLGVLVSSAGLLLTIPWRVTAQPIPNEGPRPSALPPAQALEPAAVRIREKPAPPAPTAPPKRVLPKPTPAPSAPRPVILVPIAPKARNTSRLRLWDVAPKSAGQKLVRPLILLPIAPKPGSASRVRLWDIAPKRSSESLVRTWESSSKGPGILLQPVTPKRPLPPTLAEPRRMWIAQSPRPTAPAPERSEAETRRALLQAQEAVREAQRQLERALRELPDQRRAMEEALRKLPEQERQMAAARRQLEAALRALPDHQRQMESARRQLEAARRQLQEAPSREGRPDRPSEQRGLDEGRRREMERRLNEMKRRLDTELRQSPARQRQLDESQRRMEERRRDLPRMQREIRERVRPRLDQNNVRSQRTLQEHLLRLEQLQRELDEQLRRPPQPQSPPTVPDSPPVLPQPASPAAEA